jgi:hypothetical protein
LGTEGYEAAEKEAKRLTEETGIEHAIVHSFRAGRQIARREFKPFESLGKRFTSMLKNQWKNKAIREAKGEAKNADKAEDGWAYLQARGTETTKDLKKRREERLKHKGATKRGFSEAALYQGLTGTVERKGHTVEVKDANPERVANTFRMRNIDFGQEGYMSQADREHHLKMFEGAMHDFSEILGVEPAVLSLNGRLGIAFGARGRGAAKAHYEPSKKVINITKFTGGGSLSHEWGHALDNVMAGLFRSEGAGRAGGIYISETPSSQSYPPKVRSAIQSVMHAIKKHPDPVTARAAHRAKLNELMKETDKAIAASNVIVKQHNELRKRPESQEQLDRYVRAEEKRIKQYRDEIRSIKAAVAAKPSGKPTQKQTSDLGNYEFWLKKRQGKLKQLKDTGFRTEEDNAKLEELRVEADIARLDINRRKSEIAKYRKIDPEQSDFATGGQLMGKYWGSDVELFARAFESWVQDELAAANRKSDYLTGGVKTTRPIDTGHTLPNGKQAQVYPRGMERETIGVAMRGLIDTLNETGTLEKALRFLIPLEAR